MYWLVWSNPNKRYLIAADSFDEALAKGREIDPKVSIAQMHNPTTESLIENLCKIY